MATVFGIARQNNGNVWVYSELGKGSTFKVYFPRTDAKPIKVAERPELTTVRGTETVLLVEGEEQLRTVATDILKRNGYFVLSTQNGGEALLLCEKHRGPIHLLLTDVVMPLMSGSELAERLLPMRPEMKPLYTSGYTEDAIVHHRVLNSGISLLPKPIAPDALLRKVRETLDDAA